MAIPRALKYGAIIVVAAIIIIFWVAPLFEQPEPPIVTFDILDNYDFGTRSLISYGVLDASGPVESGRTNVEPFTLSTLLPGPHTITVSFTVDTLGCQYAFYGFETFIVVLGPQTVVVQIELLEATGGNCLEP